MLDLQEFLNSKSSYYTTRGLNFDAFILEIPLDVLKEFISCIALRHLNSPKIWLSIFDSITTISLQYSLTWLASLLTTSDNYQEALNGLLYNILIPYSKDSGVIIECNSDGYFIAKFTDNSVMNLSKFCESVQVRDFIIKLSCEVSPGEDTQMLSFECLKYYLTNFRGDFKSIPKENVIYRLYLRPPLFN